MTSAESPERLPPVTVDCGRCSAQFLSRARHMMSVHCPRCGHSSRVKRWTVAGPSAGPVPALMPARESKITPVGGIGAVGGGDVVGDQADDEGDETYVYDEFGRLVPAEWTGDGRLVPAARPAVAGPQVPEITWGGALAVLGWRLCPTIGGCQVVEASQLCGAETTRRITGGWVCGPHYSALCSVIIRRSA
ncbi:MAG TPA: hypothetical protein VFQ68_13225 [Streptosporangiaceae bacterium]|nr:hypothetical protein [Streptosporangiaceae bacterium]